MNRARAQSLVELALVAPILMVLAMLAWDGGGVLREQVILNQAARDGARFAASQYAGADVAMIRQAVLESARDLPTLSSTAGYLTVSNPDATSVRVTLVYDHALWTPLVRNVWAGGSGTIRLQSSATFFLPQLTPVPSPVSTSTPKPTPTPTSTPVTPTSTPVPPTPTPTRTPTPSPTPNPVVHCTLTIPPLDNNHGWVVWVQTTSNGPVTATWTMRFNIRNNIEIDMFDIFPLDQVAGDRDNTVKLTVTSSSLSPDVYAIYFYNRGNDLPLTTTATLDFNGTTCPTSGF